MFLLVLLSAQVSGQSPAKVEKRISKNMASAWPEREISRAPLDLDPETMLKAGREATGSLYRLVSGDEWLGMMVLASAKGRYEHFDYMVLYDTSYTILMVDILVYRSDHGYEIMNKGWLGQFKGHDGCGLDYGKDIDAISGATFSASSLTTDIQKWCTLLGSRAH